MEWLAEEWNWEENGAWEVGMDAEEVLEGNDPEDPWLRGTKPPRPLPPGQDPTASLPPAAGRPFVTVFSLSKLQF